MRETKEKEINGTLYACTQFMPTDALEYQLELLKIIGKPLGGLFSKTDIKMDGSENAAEDLKESKYDIEAAVSMLSDSIKPKFHTKFIKEMMKGVTVNGMKLHFDNHFQGKIMEIYSVLLFVIETNYPDFFSVVVGKVGMMQASDTSEQSEEHSEDHLREAS